MVPKRRIRIALGGAALLVLGVLSHSWWTGGGALGSVRIGLRGASMCFFETCETVRVDAYDVGAYAQLGLLTWYACLLAAGLTVAAALLRERYDLERWSKPIGFGCLAVIGLVVACFATSPDGASVSWAPLATLAGAGLCAWAGLGDLDSPVVAPPPVSVPTARARSLPAQGPMPVPRPAPARPPAGAPHAMEYSHQVAEATKVVAPKPQRRRDTRRALLRGDSTIAVPDAAIDQTRRSLRFVARRLTIEAGGLLAEPERGEPRRLAWSELGRLAARQLPPDPPFEKAVFLDVVPVSGAPIRILPSTIANYADLPGGAAAGARQNLRRLAMHIQKSNPKVEIEPESSGFLLEGKAPPQFAAMKQFAAYDARYA